MEVRQSTLNEQCDNWRTTIGQDDDVHDTHTINSNGNWLRTINTSRGMGSDVDSLQMIPPDEGTPVKQRVC